MRVRRCGGVSGPRCRRLRQLCRESKLDSTCCARGGLSLRRGKPRWSRKTSCSSEVRLFTRDCFALERVEFSSMSGSRALLVFAKTPKPGKVKTRLLAAVAAEVAAALHEGCIADTLRLGREIRGGRGFVVSAGGGRLFLTPVLGRGERGAC